MKCVECKFYKQGEELGAMPESIMIWGWCQRFPPNTTGDIPRVKDDFWCGEFKVKECDHPDKREYDWGTECKKCGKILNIRADKIFPK